MTIDLCTFLSGVLCPLPQVNFTGYGTYPMPAELASEVPTIAWTVPNLEAYARVELVNQATGEVAACLQATLSNGWSTKYKGVTWGSGMFTLTAVLVALAHAVWGRSTSPAMYRWFDVLFLFQTAAAAGLMHLNYPLVFSNFAQNFTWALGLLHSASMQTSISKMRDKTGGKLADSAYSQVQYINRKLSPYNVLSYNLSKAFANVDSVKSFIADVRIPSNTLATLKRSVGALHGRADIPSLIDQHGASDLTTGIPVYVNSANIPLANAYDTVFFWFLAFIAIFLAFHVLLGALVFALSRGKGNDEDQQDHWASRLRHQWWPFCVANALRTAVAFFFPVFIFGFYQWTIGRKDSGLSIFFSVLGMLAVLAPLVWALTVEILKARRESYDNADVSELYTEPRVFNSVGVLYRPYRQRFHWFWFAPLLLATIARSGFIAFGQSRPWAQVIGCLVVEFIVFVTLIVCRPHKDRKGDWLAPVLSFFRMALFGLLVAFIEDVKLKAIPRTIIGIVMIALVGIPTVILLVGLIWNAGYGWLWRRQSTTNGPKAGIEDGAMLDNNRSTDMLGQEPMRGARAGRGSRVLSSTVHDVPGLGTNHSDTSDSDFTPPTPPTPQHMYAYPTVAPYDDDDDNKKKTGYDNTTPHAL